MSSNIVPFEYGEHQIRTVVIDDSPWFVAGDLARVLGYSSTAAATRTLDEDEKGVHILHTLGGDQSVTIINEPGMYSLILRSRVEEARQFRWWITHEVIPSIRQTGAYGVPALTEDQIVQQALAITHQRVQVLEAKVKDDAPKVEYHQRFVAEDDDIITVDNFASQFESTGPKVRELMRSKNLATRKLIGQRWSDSKQRMEDEFEWRPRQGVSTSDWFVLRPQHNAPRLHNGQVRQTMYVKQFHADDLARKLGLVLQELS